MSKKHKNRSASSNTGAEKSIPLQGKEGSSVKAGKSIRASALGLDTFGGGFNRNFMMNRSAYYSTYGNGDISSMQTINDVPVYFRMLNENNGGMFYWPTTLKEKYEFYRYFCYYLDDDGKVKNQCLIHLPDGTRKDIRDLNIGDEILDGNGRITKVKEKNERKCDDEFAVQFDVTCIQEKFKTTPEHPFFVLKKEKVLDGAKIRKEIDFTPEWIKAGEIQTGDYLLRPLNVFKEDSPITEDEAYLLGCYAAEGSVIYGMRSESIDENGRGYHWHDKKVRTPVGIAFSINRNEEDTYGKKFEDTIRTVFNVRCRVYHLGDTGSEYQVKGRKIADFFVKHVGAGSDKILLSNELMNSSREAKIAFLSGYSDGDGCYNKSGTNKGEITIVTNSHQLASQVVSICLSLGIIARQSRYSRQPNDGFGGPNPKDFSRVQIPAISSGIFFEKSTKWGRIDLGEKKPYDRVLLSNGYVLYKIRKAERVKGGGTVYNIGVESDIYNEQSYIANGVISHNCRKDPIVKRAVEFHTDLPMSKLILRMPKLDDKELSEKIRKRYESMVKEIKLFDRLHSILFELNVIGNAFVFCEFDETRKQWSKLIILPPEEVNVAQYPMSDNSRIEYRPEQLNTILRKCNPSVVSEEAYLESIENLDSSDRMVMRGVPYSVAKQLLENEGVIVMDTNPYTGEGDHKIGSFVYHFAEKRHPYYDLGVSPLECILEPLLMKEFYKNTQLTLSSRNMTPRNKISAPEITPDQLEDLREQLDQSMLNPDYTIATNYEWSWEQIGADNRLIDLGKEYEEINEQFYAGLGLTKEMITGEGLHSGSKINVELLNTRYMFKREILIDYVENCLFEPMAEENGWYSEDDDGNKEYYYPRLSFSRLSIRDNAEVFDSLFQLYQKGSLPIDVILELFNLDSDEILEKLKQDQFTPKDAVYNDMIRAIYQSISDNIAQNTDLADQVIRSLTGPGGARLNKVQPPQDDMYASKTPVENETLQFNNTENADDAQKESVQEKTESHDDEEEVPQTAVETPSEASQETTEDVKEIEAPAPGEPTPKTDPIDVNEIEK